MWLAVFTKAQLINRKIGDVHIYISAESALSSLYGGIWTVDFTEMSNSKNLFLNT